RKRLPVDVTAQRFAIQELHGDERAAVLLADVINSANGRVIQSGCSSRLASKPLERQRLLREGFGEEFQGHRTVEAVVVSLVYDTHPAGAKLFQDAIVRNGLTDHGPAKFWVSRNSG